MAILSANKQRPKRLPAGGLTFRELALTGYTNHAGGSTNNEIFHGSMVVSDVSDADGYFRAVPLTSSTNMASGDIFGGVAIDHALADSTQTADGAVSVSVAVTGVFGFAVGSLAVTDIGAPAYASDDDTIGTSSTNTLWVGTIVAVDSTNVWVDISHAAGRTNTAT